ncbi:alpha/beta fold hydrolase [Rhizorhabdus sp. FW153]|uniref:alpha/beta fold hydrolase n=1 Tax=Rhizorhabdus sp. FW153 TaxID=3400216 RepID=UPI003CFBB11B
MNAVPVKRGFVDLPHGQMHYRMAGDSGEALLILHASPGSSRQQLRTIEDFAADARVVAPDTPGNGDSVALFDREPTISELAAAMLQFLSAVGLDRVRVYGSHTGAAIATELAILAPERVSALVLDGVSLMQGEELDEVLARYAFPFEPDLDGAYLMRLFQFCRDQYLFFPWYRRTRAGRRDGGLGNAADLHAWITEVMKASTTYHLNYRAAFKWPADQCLPLVQCPTLVTAAVNDPLYDSSVELEKLLADGRFEELPRLDAEDFRASRKAAIDSFFGGLA